MFENSKPIKTIETAKLFFKKYGGHHFHMCREEPDRYKEYYKMCIQKPQEQAWREELIVKTSPK